MKDSSSAAGHNRLEHYPITFFAVVMGLGGLALALHAGEVAMGWPHGLSVLMLLVTATSWIAIASIYIWKWLRHPEAVRAEWHHPVRIAFFPTITIGLLLIATALRPHIETLAHGIWYIGMIGQGALTLAVISNWIGVSRSFQHGHLNPAWFIPAVGNVVVPLAGAPLGHIELSWLFFSGGVLFWGVLLTLVMNRLIFHDPLPGRLYPTLMILVAPPAVAFISWFRLTGEIDPIAHILVSAGYIFAAIVAIQLPRILRLPFAMSWWALSFPLAALCVMSFVYGAARPSGLHVMLGKALLAALIVLIAILLVRTFNAMKRGEVCVPE